MQIKERLRVHGYACNRTPPSKSKGALQRPPFLCACVVGASLIGGCDIGPSETDSEGNGGAQRSAKVACQGGGSSGTPSTVTVDTRSNVGVLSTIAVGANAAAWDTNLTDPELPRLLADAGLQVLRYPGGSNFDAYMSVVRATGAQSMVTVNYGSGTAQEAADWVRYANRGGHHYNGPVPTYAGASSTGHSYGIKYWEIGNEMYGDGTYGATWEVNHNAHDPTTYANGVHQDWCRSYGTWQLA